MITYRIVQYRCMCKYIYTGVRNRSSKCPEHGTTQRSVTFWCAGCGKKYKVVPVQGLRERCNDCSAYRQRGKTNLAFQEKYNEKHDISELTSETLEQKEERHFNEVFEAVRVKYAPPVVDGMSGTIL